MSEEEIRKIALEFFKDKFGVLYKKQIEHSDYMVKVRRIQQDHTKQIAELSDSLQKCGVKWDFRLDELGGFIDELREEVKILGNVEDGQWSEMYNIRKVLLNFLKVFNDEYFCNQEWYEKQLEKLDSGGENTVKGRSVERSKPSSSLREADSKLPEPKTEPEKYYVPIDKRTTGAWVKELLKKTEERVRGATRKELIEDLQTDLDSLSPDIPYQYEPLNKIKKKWQGMVK